MSELSTETLIAQGFNFTDLEEVEPIPEPPVVAPSVTPNPENVIRVLPAEIQGILAPLPNPEPERQREEVKCCPLCGAPEDWDDF